MTHVLFFRRSSPSEVTGRFKGIFWLHMISVLTTVVSLLIQGVFRLEICHR